MSFTYSADVVPEPKHLDLEFFNDVLENALLRNNFQIQNVEFTMGSSSGENYCSQIYRVKVTFKCSNRSDETTEDSLSLIIKNMPRTEATEFLVDLNAFLKEKIVYNNVLPRLEVLFKDDIKFAPRLYHTVKNPINALAFEDLAVSNYKLGSRENGLNLPHALLVMKKLAQFHAASRKLFEKAPELIPCFHSGMISEDSLRKDDGMLMQFYGNNINALIDLIEQWSGYEKITQKIKNYAKNLKSNLIRTGAAVNGEFKVLNHGDLWVNNILYKYDSQDKPIDLNFVDFQLPVWNSLGIDLNYFFYTSVEFDVLQNNLEVLKRQYYQTLSTTMKDLGLDKIPTYEEINNEIQNRQLYGFFSNFGEFPMICQDKELSQDSNFENYTNDDFAKQRLKLIFASKRLEQTYRYTLKEFDKMGILD